MLALYLICLIFGGVFLIVTLMSGSDIDSDIDIHGDFSGDLNADLSTDLDGDLSTDADVDGEGLADAVKFLSFRNIVFFLAFFGLSGVCLTLLKTSAVISLITSVVMGAFAGLLVHKLMHYLKRTESGSTMNLRSIEGTKAKVVIGLSRQRLGKIAIHTGEQFLQVLAKVAEESDKDHFSPGEIVTVVRIEGDLALVAEENFISEGVPRL